MKRILIDATYPTNTQVAVVENDKLVELEYSAPTKKIVKGNIYLAKITRIEPSLQAAFVDYGGDRHGFVPFAEIHASYYNIPAKYKSESDKAEEFQEEELSLDHDIANNEQEELFESSEENGEKDLDANSDNASNTADSAATEDDEASIEKMKKRNVEKYKIQEVLKRNQVLLIQAIKEERGNKGASFTTYISLAGRYCVLMPNSEFKGGVSKKISDSDERKRLKGIVDNINDDSGFSNLIIRTIGKDKNEDEIKQDYNYLVRMWNEIREKTLSSSAPAFIHSEEDLLKKVIRDLYDDETSEVLVQSDQKYYQEAVQIAATMSYSRKIIVKKHNSKLPIFTQFKIDDQIMSLYNPIAYLDSGAYIVINHTEALIAIDVNSGRSISERNIESMALRTNLEAAKEVVRQIKLRDLSGLIVVDFIDMMELRNRRLVERAMREGLYNDKARVQISQISSLGLLEISRQRLKPNFLESNTMPCSVCSGKGVVRSSEINSIMVLRTVEKEIAVGSFKSISVYASAETVLHILNHRREEVRSMETRYKVNIYFYQDPKLSSDGFAIEILEDKVHEVNEQPQGGNGKNNKKRKKNKDNRKPENNTQPSPEEKSVDTQDSEPKAEEKTPKPTKPSKSSPKKSIVRSFLEKIM